MVIVPAVLRVISPKVARPFAAALVVVPPTVKDEGAMVTLSVSEVLLPYASVISMVKVSQVAPTATELAGWVTQRSLLFVAADMVIAEVVPDTLSAVAVIAGVSPELVRVNPVTVM